MIIGFMVTDESHRENLRRQAKPEVDFAVTVPGPICAGQYVRVHLLQSRGIVRVIATDVIHG
jgi:hypothetical protein